MSKRRNKEPKAKPQKKAVFSRNHQKMIDGYALTEPGYSRGILDLGKYFFLLKLIVKKEIKARYRNSVLGLLWTYIKPAVSFGVYYFFVGYVLTRHHAIDHYATYLFSGMVIVFLFDETLRNCAHSIRGNAALVKKIYLPRELFPIASWGVAMVHFLPQLALLLIGAILTGWTPDLISVGAILLSIAIISIFTIGLGLIFATLNVFFMDSQNLVDMITSVSTWFSPVLYTAPLVSAIVPHWLFVLYSMNPITASVNLLHYGFWFKSVSPADRDIMYLDNMPDGIFNYALYTLILALIIIVVGQIVFRRQEGKFAQEL